MCSSDSWKKSKFIDSSSENFVAKTLDERDAKLSEKLDARDEKLDARDEKLDAKLDTRDAKLEGLLAEMKALGLG